MTSTKWHTSMSLAEIEDDEEFSVRWYDYAASATALGLGAALFGLLAWGGYWLGKHWRLW
jgi:hypothetical protein